VNGPDLNQARQDLAGLAGLEPVAEQLAGQGPPAGRRIHSFRAITFWFCTVPARRPARSAIHTKERALKASKTR
jgi:hypothetical protein